MNDSKQLLEGCCTKSVGYVLVDQAAQNHNLGTRRAIKT